MLLEAIILPIFFVSSIIILSLELLDPQKTQIFLREYLYYYVEKLVLK